MARECDPLLSTRMGKVASKTENFLDRESGYENPEEPIRCGIGGGALVERAPARGTTIPGV